jgi:lysozyme
MALADAYVDRIKKFEGYAARPVWDYKQYSGGYGTRAQPGMVFTPETADAALRSELGQAKNHVAKLGVQLTPGQEAALTSLTFNAGPGWMNAGLGQAVKAGDWDKATSLFQQYNKAGGEVLPGLVSRRAAEASWMTGGDVPRETQAAHGSFRAAQDTQGQPMQPMGFMPQIDPAMMQQQPGQQQGGLGGLLHGVTSNPLFLMGAGVLGGQNVGQGLMGGMQMANSMQAQQMDRAMKERQFQEQLRMHNQTLALQQQAEQRNAQMTPYQIKLLQTQAAEAEGKAGLSQQERAMQQQFIDAARAYQQGGQAPAMPQPQAMPPQMAPGGGLSAAAAAPQAMPQAMPVAQGAPQAAMPTPQAPQPQQGVMTQYGMLPPDLAETAAMRAAAGGKGDLAKMVQEKVDTARAGGQSKKFRETSDATTAEAVAKARLDLPVATQKAQEALAQINELKTHEGRGLATGMLSTVPGVPGTRQFDFITAHDNLINKTYLTAIQAFVGMGALSNAEGEAAKSAATDLKRGQTGPAYERSLAKLEKSIQKGLENAQMKAGASGGQQPAAPASPAAQPAAVPLQAVEYLRANPALAAQFEEKYGTGSAASILGQR